MTDLTLLKGRGYRALNVDPSLAPFRPARTSTRMRHCRLGGPVQFAGFGNGIGIVNPAQLEACLGHLEAAEELMVEAGDLAGLSRLSLVIEMLRRAHGMPDRPIDLAEFSLDSPTVEGSHS